MILAVCFIAGCGRIEAQSTYYDVVLDGVDNGLLDFDYYGEGAPPQPSGHCAASIQIASTLDGSSLSAFADYPNIAHTFQQQTIDLASPYSWEQDE